MPSKNYRRTWPTAASPTRVLAERASDVLVIDKPIDQRNPATEPRRQPMRLQMVTQDTQQLFRACGGVFRDPCRVGPIQIQSSYGQAPQQPGMSS